MNAPVWRSGRATLTQRWGCGRSARRQEPGRSAARSTAALTITPTRWPPGLDHAFQQRAAARQPVGSTTIFMRSAKKRIVVTSCASLTVTMPFTRRWMTGKVNRPLCCVCAPSAIVCGVSMCTISRAPGFAGCRCRLRARHRSRRSRATDARPHGTAGDQPPPPTQTSSRSNGPVSSRSSSAAVPCPAMTCA